MLVREYIKDITTGLKIFFNALRGTTGTTRIEDLDVDKLHGLLLIDIREELPMHLHHNIATGLNEPDTRRAHILISAGWTVKTVELDYVFKSKYYGCNVEEKRYKLLYYIIDKELYAKVKTVRERQAHKSYK